MHVGDGGGGGGGAVVGSEAGLEAPEPPSPPGAVGGPEVAGAWLTAPEAVAVAECLPLAVGLGDVESPAEDEAEAEAEAEEASDAGLAVTLATEEACAEVVAPGEALGLGTSSEPADWVRSPVT